MFGGAKPTFGTTTTGVGFGGFTNTATASPFAQSAFGKPATAAFGATSTFGTQQTTPSLFGAGAGQTQASGIFGGPSTSTAFGATTATQPSFGGFSQPQLNTSIFGAAQPTANTSSPFGQPSTSAFGSAVKPGGLGGFGQTAVPPTTSLFGQQPTSMSSTGFGTFGQAAPTTTTAFGGTATSAFGQPAAGVSPANAGTSICKYQPTIGTDTLMKGGQPNNVNTKQHCITAMKEYESKSLEELRMEDYLANRKGPQASTSAAGGFFGTGAQSGATNPGLFGASTQPSGLFGQSAPGVTENKGMFGSSAFGQPTTSTFGGGVQQQNSFLAKPFGAPAATGFGTDGGTNPFGAKPAFGQPQTGTPSLFGQTSAANTAPAFGQTTTGFGGFGTQAGSQQPTMFGAVGQDANKPTFGLGGTSTANTGFAGFGTTATSTASGGLFGNKPATGFGNAPAFGATSTANTGFSNFSMGNTGGGLFNSNLNKPATSGFGGFGTQTSTAPMAFNTGAGGSTLFGNAAAKPGGLFGNPLGTGTNPTAGGMFGGGGGAFGTNTSLSGGFGTNTLGGMNATLGGSAQPQAMPIHQQILSKVTSPYGDNPIFKDLKRGDDELDATRATNPLAQKAILESSNHQFKISTSSSPSVVKVTPIANAITKKSLFEGLEEYDASVESFTLKPNAKRLILKPKVTSSPSIYSGSSGSQSRPGTPHNTSIGAAPNGGNSANSTPQRLASDNASLNLSSSIGATRKEPYVSVSSLNSPGTALRNNVSGAGVTSGASTSTPVATATAAAVGVDKDSDASRRESWLHPHNLEKVRQLNAMGRESIAPLNTTLTDLVPRKPLDTYHPSSAANVRHSKSAVPDNSFDEPSTSSNTTTRRETGTFIESTSANESQFSNRSYSVEDRSVIEDPQAEYEEHPTGITLRRAGYYTIPSMDDLKSYLAEDGSCIVPNFTVGREGYGNVYFGKEMDVAGINLDEIVHFRNKEIIIYPDDDNKPPIGNGLNREAQVTLDQVWPHDKTKHEPIKDPVRLAGMNWEGKLRRVCNKNDTRFIEYRPETGSWVFRVKHFSKYGLSDSDEDEDNTPADAKKAKMAAAAASKIGANAADKHAMAARKNSQKVSDDAAHSLDPKSLSQSQLNGMDESAEFMLMDKTQYFQSTGADYSMFEQTGANCLPPSLIGPTAILANNIGTDAQKLQLMKASLFVDDDDESETSESTEMRAMAAHHKSSGIFGSGLHDYYAAMASWKQSGDVIALDERSDTSSQMDFCSRVSPLPDYSETSEGSVSHAKRVTELPSPPRGPYNVAMYDKLPPFVLRPKVAPLRSLAVQLPFAKSIARPLCQKWHCDLGIYNIRRFKLSFGPRTKLIVPTTRCNLTTDLKDQHLCDAIPKIFSLRSPNDFSATMLQHIQITSVFHNEHFNQSIVDHLKIQLSNSLKDDVEGSECPWIRPNGGTDLIVSHLDEAIKLINLSPLEEYAVSVWSLCLALWGENEELEGHEPNSHFVVMCRRNLLSEWLENALTEKDLLKKSVSKHTYLDHMLELIMCHKVTEACELAFQYDDANLSLLLSQLSSGPTVRQLMEDQLAAWHKNRSDTFIQLERLKLFMLVAGVSLMNSAHGPINTLEGLDWIKVLAIQLWYLSPATSSITDALLAYEKSFTAEQFYSLPPSPSYPQKNVTYKQQQNVFDLRYHLLQLFSKRSHPMEKLLNPATHTADPMDYRLSWLLLQTLEALGYHHCSELSKSQIHVGFASQLENNNLWEWAIFVLLHIKERNQRELAVQNMLYRYVTVSKDVMLTEKEKFVVNNLGVPAKWMDFAKAVKAGSLGNHCMQAKYLLRAKQWSLAHEIIFNHIAPEAIINEKLDYLHSLLSQFEDAELHQTIKVPNWSNEGQIYLEYIDINRKFLGMKKLKAAADIEARWENLKPQLADLCSRINLLPCPTSKHRLCQSEIAQNLACLVRGVLLVCPILNPCLMVKIALERLPLPQEFTQQEVRTLLDTILVDLDKINMDDSNMDINSEL